MLNRKANVTSKGRITIPKDIRNLLKIGPGDKINFIIDEQGKVSISRLTCDFRSLKGLFHKKKRKLKNIKIKKNFDQLPDSFMTYFT